MNIQSVLKGGLFGEYFSNRWLFGEPVSTHHDGDIDFWWSEHDPITSTGKDFVSIRWSGYLKPLFSELYTFTIRVNDGVNFCVDNKVLLDEYDTNTPKDKQFIEYNVTTNALLVAGRLTDIKIEFRENRGAAMISFLWSSKSQHLSIISSEFLYSQSKHIAISPISVTPSAIELSPPVNCQMSVVDWNQLEVEWEEPLDDGGDAIQKYKVEYWDNNPICTERLKSRESGSVKRRKVKHSCCRLHEIQL